MVSSLDRARDAIGLVAATVDALAGVVGHTIFGEGLVDGRAATHGIVFMRMCLNPVNSLSAAV